MVLGAATSILTAADDLLKIPKLWLILLPALSSLLAAIISQFRFKDLSRIREEGRISAELLVSEAFLIPIDCDNASAMKAAVALRQAAHELELKQLELVLGDRSIFKADQSSKIRQPTR